VPCPEFEYEHYPQYAAVLQPRIAKFLGQLRAGHVDTRSVAKDTRAQHRLLFDGLTPTGHQHYAGNYRGEALVCLDQYKVFVPGDPLVGAPPESVGALMNLLAGEIDRALTVLDTANQLPQLSSAAKLQNVVAVTCMLFEKFLAIHPYANGNGHIGRMLVWLILGRYNYWPEAWPIEPRPPDPPYTTLIKYSRAGNREPLEKFVLQTIKGAK
jgi:fido (protein-threonine AMPylation protein)